MRNSKLLFFSFLLMVLTCNMLYGQQSIPNCDELKVEVKTTSPVGGLANGSISFVFQESPSNYKIYWLNAGSDKTQKLEVRQEKIESLKAGFFDILIIDKNRKGCIKQLTVVLK